MKRNTLTGKDIIEIRKKLSANSRGGVDVGAIEPINANAMESALSRQNTGFGGELKYTKAHEIGASLFYGIAMNHAFENGNKRTALVSMLVCLNFNDVSLEDSTEEELYRMATSLVNHQFPDASASEWSADDVIEALARWIRERSKKNPKFTDRATDWKDFRAILTAQGCEFQKPSKNFVRITRGKLSAKTGYPRENFTIPAQEVKRLRRALKLNRISTSEFYDLDRNVDRIVAKHANLLERLADA